MLSVGLDAGVTPLQLSTEKMEEKTDSLTPESAAEESQKKDPIAQQSASASADKQ